MITVAIGQAEGIETRSVIQDVLIQCRAQLSGVTPGAGIVFAAVQFDHQLVLDSILQAFPNLELVGCTTAGDFSTRLGFCDDAVTLMLFHSDDVEIRAGIGRNLTQAPDAAVRSAVAQARDRLSGAPQFGLAFPDGYDKRFDHIMTILNRELGPDCPVFGGAAGMLWTEEQIAKQFYRNEVLEDAFPMLLWAGPVVYDFAIANSWKPVGKKATVTASQGRTVDRIGSTTAVDFYRHYLGEHTEPAREFILAVTEGEEVQAYLRAPISYNPDGSITFSESVPQGAVVQLTEAIRDVILQDTHNTAEALSRDLPFQPRFGLAFSCAFRKDVLGTRTPEELAILREVLPPGLPIGGFYSFGEIAPLERHQPTRLHGATLVTLLVGQKDVGPLSSEAGVDTSGASAVETQTALGPEALATENAYLKHKLERSEAYRKRIEELKDLNAAMHRTIIREVEEARLEILQKDAALRKSEEKHRRIVETAGEGFVLMDENLTIVDVNEAYCRLLGYTREELLGRTPLNFTTEEYQQILSARQEKLLEQEYRSLESILVRKDGRHVPILIHGNRLRDDAGAVIGNMAFVTDMTEHKKALALAGEVQKSLLPQKDPAIPGFDVAGRNVSCEEIGGDYFDFFWRRESPREPFGIVVGDITGHGVDSALLMSSARAFLHMRVSQPGTVSEIVSAMNVQMVQDVLDSGRFMTLFYLMVDPTGDALHWVRAGHDPAILYDPEQDIFEELDGPGIALGVDPNYIFKESHRTGLHDGQVVAVGTDGIWEAFSKEGQMYGKTRFRELLRRHADLPARDILDAVYSDVMTFIRGRKSDDDITLVILKINRSGSW